MAEAYTRLLQKGAKEFGIHAFLASNTVTDDYYPELAGILFRLAVRLHEKTGAHIGFINLSGGVGIPYQPGQRANDIFAIGEGVRKQYEDILVPAGMGDIAIYTEMGRYMLGPTARWSRRPSTKSISTRNISVSTLARPTSCARPCTARTTTSRCWARRLPPPTMSTISWAACARTTTSLPSTAPCRKSTAATCCSSMTPARTASRWATTITQAAQRRGAAARDGSHELIRRAETPADYFATLDCNPVLQKDGLLRKPVCQKPAAARAC